MSQQFSTKGSGIGEATIGKHGSSGYPNNTAYDPEVAQEVPVVFNNPSGTEDGPTTPTKVGAYVSAEIQDTVTTSEYSVVVAEGAGTQVDGPAFPHTPATDGEVIPATFEVTGPGAMEPRDVKLRVVEAPAEVCTGGAKGTPLDALAACNREHSYAEDTQPYDEEFTNVSDTCWVALKIDRSFTQTMNFIVVPDRNIDFHLFVNQGGFSQIEAEADVPGYTITPDGDGSYSQSEDIWLVFRSVDGNAVTLSLYAEQVDDPPWYGNPLRAVDNPAYILNDTNEGQGGDSQYTMYTYIGFKVETDGLMEDAKLVFNDMNMFTTPCDIRFYTFDGNDYIFQEEQSGVDYLDFPANSGDIYFTAYPTQSAHIDYDWQTSANSGSGSGGMIDCMDGFEDASTAQANSRLIDTSSLVSEMDSTTESVGLGDGMATCYWAPEFDTSMAPNGTVYNIYVSQGDGNLDMQGWDGVANGMSNVVMVSSEAGGFSEVTIEVTQAAGGSGSGSASGGAGTCCGGDYYQDQMDAEMNAHSVDTSGLMDTGDSHTIYMGDFNGIGDGGCPCYFAIEIDAQYGLEMNITAGDWSVDMQGWDGAADGSPHTVILSGDMGFEYMEEIYIEVMNNTAGE